MEGKKKILVAPLNWGLGHATRCIPIIRTLVDQKASILIGADGRPLDLLRSEFPDLQFIKFPGLNISYEGNLTRSMIRQLPHVASVTIQEHRMLETILAENEIDAVISDNRFGLYSSKVPCVYVTHQIGIVMPGVLQWAKSPVARIQKFLINRFNECWVPDFAGHDNLSGDLSHDIPLPSNTHYVGPLSRFQKLPDISRQYDIIAVLSGPEPQRTVLEELIVGQLAKTHLKSLVVRGTPEVSSEKAIGDNIVIVSHLSSHELNKAILAAEIVVSRPGYSTIMDLAVLGGKAIFIPTPGQTEQEYLAALYLRRRIFYSESQKEFEIDRALDRTRDYSGFATPASGESTLTRRVQHLLASIAT